MGTAEDSLRTKGTEVSPCLNQRKKERGFAR